jgi:hypothetical protein
VRAVPDISAKLLAAANSRKTEELQEVSATTTMNAMRANKTRTLTQPKSSAVASRRPLFDLLRTSRCS